MINREKYELLTRVDFKNKYKLNNYEWNEMVNNIRSKDIVWSPKKVLVALEKEGVLTPSAIMSDSAFSGLVILEWDSYHVFGYAFYNDVKSYFRVKMQAELVDPCRDYFTVNGRKCFLNEFMRV